MAEDFKLDPQPLPTLDEGQFLIRNHYASLDPAMRGWLDDAPSYMPPVRIGDPVRASTIGIVSDSRNPDVPVGQWVMGLNGIEEYSVGNAGGFTQPIDPAAVPSVTNYLSLFGAVGLTAYFGFLDVCEPKAGDTVLVTGAAGAVGSLVGQIAKIEGCRTIGIAGGPEKCARLTARYGFDDAIDDVPRFGEGAAAMGQWLTEGRLVLDEHIDEGIDNALPAFMRLFNGTNDGKMILKIASGET